MATGIVAPHGGTLVDLLLTGGHARQLKIESRDLPSLDLTQRQLCDVEMLITGAFSPLTGFMGRQDYESVLSALRLADGTLWPVPIVLDVASEVAAKWRIGERVALRDPEGTMIAVLTVTEMWSPNKAAEAEQLYGTTKSTNPQARNLLEKIKDTYVAGSLQAAQVPARYNFLSLRQTPGAVRAALEKRGYLKNIAYHAAELMHRKHVEFTRAIAQKEGAGLLINAVVGNDDAGDLSYLPRVRCYKAILDQYPHGMATLNLIPLISRCCGAREALWQAIISKNYGCSHVVIGHDHDHSGENAMGAALYGSYAGQDLVAKHRDELGLTIVRLRDLVLEEDRVEYFLPNAGKPTTNYVRRLMESLSDAEKSAILHCFTYPALIKELSRFRPPREKQGITIFFTGLSGSGKSTISNVLVAKLAERDARSITLLDGDIVRKHLSSELGFSREHRDINVRRMGYVASLITKNQGIAICAPIAPYEKTRTDVRAMVEANGSFIEVYVATPLDICEARDRKGLYAKARAGIVKEFTGISDPYEPPSNPEIVIKTAELSAEEAATRIIQYLEHIGLISPIEPSESEYVPSHERMRRDMARRTPKLLMKKEAT